MEMNRTTSSFSPGGSESASNVRDEPPLVLAIGEGFDSEVCVGMGTPGSVASWSVAVVSEKYQCMRSRQCR